MPIDIFLYYLVNYLRVVFFKKKIFVNNKKKAPITIFRKKVSLAGSNLSIKVYKKWISDRIELF